MTTVKLQTSNNYTGERLVKLNKCIALMEKVINSDDFKTGILDFTFNGRKTFFYRNDIFGNYDEPYNNQQVYDMLMQAKEIWDANQTDFVVDLHLELRDDSDGTVIGYGNPNERKIYTYSKMFDEMEVNELVNHYVHEWAHKIGFTHSKGRNWRRQFSVPYGVGDVAEQVAEKINN